MDQKRSGQFKGAKKRGFKVSGLTSEQSKRQTTLKGKKVSAGQLKKANVLKDISSTKFVKGKGVVGPGGKAFTGSVILASGKSASYVKGRRIGVQTGAAKAKPAAKGKPGTPNTPTPPKPPSGSGTPSGPKRQFGAKAVKRRGTYTPSTPSKTNKRRPRTFKGSSVAPRSEFGFTGKRKGDYVIPIGDVFRRMFGGYGGR